MIKIENLESKKRWLYRGAIALIFTVAIAFRVHYLGEKEWYHMDEVWSIALSDYNDVGWNVNPPVGSYTGDELKRAVLTPDPSVKDALYDVWQLYKHNRDKPHTNFYYSLLRLSLIGVVADDADTLMSKLNVRAGVLNLIIFTLTFIALFYLFKILLKERWLILLGLILASLNVYEVSSCVYFRPYMLQTLFTVIFMWYLIRLSQDVKSNRYMAEKRDLIRFAFLLSLLLLTGYYSFVYVFFLGGCFFFTTIVKYKRYNLILHFVKASLLALVLNIVFYNSYYGFLTSYRTSESLSGSDSLLRSFFSTLSYLHQSVFLTPVIIVVILAIVWKLCRKESFSKIKSFMWYAVAILLAIFVVVFMSPLRSPRYVFPLLVLFTAIIPLLMCGIKERLFRCVTFVIIAISMIINIYDDEGMFRYTDSVYDDYFKTPATTEPDLPVYLFFGNSTWELGILLTDLHNDQKYIICESMEDLLEKSKDMTCYILVNRFVDIDDPGFERVRKTFHTSTYRSKDTNF